MEKYKRFTDVATGINPFTGPSTSDPSLPRRLIAALLFPFAFFIALICGFCFFALRTIAYVLWSAGLTVIATPLHWIAVKTFVSVLYGGFAFGRITSNLYPAVRSSLSTKNDVASRPAPGDVIIVNSQSPLDILALQMAYPATALQFCFPTVAVVLPGDTTRTDLPDREAIVTHLNLANAMSYVLQWSRPSPSPDRPPSLPPVRDFDISATQRQARKSGTVVVFFAEGTTTNGRGILSLPRMMLESSQQLHIAALSYTNAYHALVLPSGSGLLAWSFRCLAVSLGRQGGVDVAIVRPSHIPPLPSAFNAEWSSALQSRLALAASFNRPLDTPCRPLASTATDKRFFLAYWRVANSPEWSATATSAIAKPAAAEPKVPIVDRRSKQR
jgi:hypothetical protein